MVADPHGSGTKLVRIASRPGVGLGSGVPCRSSGQCERRYAATLLDTGHPPRLAGTMMEQPGKGATTEIAYNNGAATRERTHT